MTPPIAPVLVKLAAEIGRLSEAVAKPVDVAALCITDREGLLPLDPPTTVSPNRACQLIRTADDWIALNLAREEDAELLPAWLEADVGPDVWSSVAGLVRGRGAADLIERAALLGLPAARAGEVRWEGLEAPTVALGAPQRRRERLRVVDLSALWAGPMCGAVLAAAAAQVVKVESPRRPDPTRTTAPVFFERLNGAKQALTLDLGTRDGQARLRDEVLGADILVTSARPRAFASLGLEPAEVFAANPGLTWVAITGYGWTGEAAMRVAFGDDAAAAGGLLGRTVEGEPRFLGDALSDPVTGLMAAKGALAALAAGGGVLVDAAMARCAAGAAHALGLA